MARDQQEFRLQVWVADLLRRFEPDLKWNHIPSGEKRDPRTGARLKRMGHQPGWGDLIFLFHDAPTSFLELKRPGGKLSLEQKAFKADVEALGCRYEIADTGDTAVAILKSWGLLRGLQVAA